MAVDEGRGWPLEFTWKSYSDSRWERRVPGLVVCPSPLGRQHGVSLKSLGWKWGLTDTGPS